MNGRNVFVASDCATCHKTTGQDNDELLGGGKELETDFGIFHMPNVSPDPKQGIGNWTLAEFDRAVRQGVGPSKILEVIENTSQLDWSELQAMATYLRHLDPINKPAPGVPAPNYTTKVVMLDSAFDTRDPLPTSSPQQIKAGAGATAKVLAREGDMLKLEISGWQPEEAPSVIYQEKGQRILVGVLGDKSTELLQRGKSSVDQNTDQVWVPVSFTAWSDANTLNLDQSKLWEFGKVEYQKSCASCHTMPEVDDYTSNQWIGTMSSMKRYITFNDDEYRLILAYLQNHSSDLGPNARGTK